MSQLAVPFRNFRPRGRGIIEELDVRLAAAGERQAFDRLVRRHQDAVIATARASLGHHEDALDAAQETFLKAYLHLAGFRGGSSFRTWLLRIARNTARSMRERARARKRFAAGQVSLASEPQLPDFGASPVAEVERRELEEALDEAIAGLDDTERRLVLGRGVAGKSYETLAAELGLPMGSVKSRLHRARLELRERIERFL